MKFETRDERSLAAMGKVHAGTVAWRHSAWAASLAVYHVLRAEDLGGAADPAVAAAASFAGGDPGWACLWRLPHPRRRRRRPHHRRRLPCPRSPEGPCARVRRHTTRPSVSAIAISYPSSTVSTHILKSGDRLVDVARRVFVQLLIVAEDDDRDVDGAQHGQLVRLLEQAALALEEGDRPVW